MPYSSEIAKYPRGLRMLHWVRAVLILGLIALGITMTSLVDSALGKFSVMYPSHKQFGILVWLTVLIQIGLRRRAVMPAPASGLKTWERRLSGSVHVAMYVLALIVPIMGYAMSSTYTHSDGVPFFGLTVPEVLPKNDGAFHIFQFLHKVLAFTLLGCVALHVAGVFKHRLDRDRDNDVLRRML